MKAVCFSITPVLHFYTDFILLYFFVRVLRQQPGNFLHHSVSIKQSPLFANLSVSFLLVGLPPPGPLPISSSLTVCPKSISSSYCQSTSGTAAQISVPPPSARRGGKKDTRSP